jgi:hypothetical protein
LSVRCEIAVGNEFTNSQNTADEQVSEQTRSSV